MSRHRIDGTPTAATIAHDRSPARHAVRSWRERDDDALSTARLAGAEGYDRRKLLPRLIAFDPRELAGTSPELDAAIRRRLERALRTERRRGVAGHWTYDLNRHLALARALAAEEARPARKDRTRT